MENSVYVGIGASAGGLRALETLVATLPKNMGYVYIIAQHFDPSKESTLAQILSRKSALPVLDVSEECRFLNNHIYVIPPNYNLIFKNYHLSLEKIEVNSKIPTSSIDKLFESLARFKNENSVGIVLSGSGHDGVAGLKKIKEYAGLSIAQNLQEAQYNSMPKSAVDAGIVDYVLSLEQITEYLPSLIFANQHYQPVCIPNPLKSIRKLLNDAEHIDIHKYKNEAVLRRINKRMLITHCETIDDYLQYLKSNEEEVHALYEDFLVGVTSFFRDEKAFGAMESQLLSYLKDKPENYELRIWSVACSTGEEAYSLAILISEVSKKLGKQFSLSLFASDIDKLALEKAREALYSKESLKGLSEDVVSRYFVKVEQGYRVIKSIREQIVFTFHNVLSDPPFINQDIISCRNFLIYILPEVQKEVFALFHYGLKENGVLFLGASESATSSVEYFITVDAQNSIYKKEQLKNPPKLSTQYFSKHLQQKEEKESLDGVKKDVEDIQTRVSEGVFDLFSSHLVVIDRHYTIIYKKGALPFLNFSDGFVTLNLLDNIDKALQYDVRALVENSFETASQQATKFIELASENKKFVRVIACPFQYNNAKAPTLLLYFQELSAEDLQFDGASAMLPNESFMMQSLNTQLSSAREELDSLSNKLRVNTEESQLLQEELQSANEKLQSSNEELETSNEELQSSNEELQSSLLKAKKLQQKLSLIMNSMRDGMIGLDLDGNHTFVNAAALEMLGFTQEELIGKNGHQLWHHTRADGSHYPANECKIHSTLRRGLSSVSEDLFFKKDGTSFEVSVFQNPMVEDGKVVGAVLSFRDITEQNRLKKLAQHEHQLADLYMNIEGVLVMTLDMNGNIMMINKEGARLLGVEQEEVVGQNWFDNFIEEELRDQIRGVFHQVVMKKTEMVSHYKNGIIDAKGEQHILSWTNNYLTDKDDNVIGLLSSGVDITKSEALSEQLAQQESLYKHTFEQADVGIAHVSLDGKWIDTNAYMSKLLGYTKDEFKNLSLADVTHPDDNATDNKMQQMLLENRQENYQLEKRYIHKNGQIVWVSLAVVLLKDASDQPLYFLKIIRDITELKLLMYELELERDKFKKMLESTPIPIMLYKEDGKVLFVNRFFEDMAEYRFKEIVSADAIVQKLFPDMKNKEAKRNIMMTKSGKRRVGIINRVALEESGSENKNTILLSFTDLTEMQKKDEMMLSQSRQAAMGDMLSMIAHQWRQPLSVISMAANNIHARVELEEKITSENLLEFVTTIDEQTAYLSHTVDDFRNFFKPDKKRERVNISSVFERLRTLVQQSVEDNAITLYLPKKSNIIINIYENELLQVLLNLVSNAKDAIKEKRSSEGKIEVEVEQEKESLIISVCDNGGGIDKSVEEKLGEPYVSTKSKNGTGLGLYMSRIIVSKHLGGELYWESSQKGACFYVKLPYREEDGN